MFNFILQSADKIEHLISFHKQQLAKLEELVKSRFIEMFGNSAKGIVRAGSILSQMRNGLSPSSRGTYHARVLTLSAFTQGKFNAELWKDGMFDFNPPAEKKISSSDFYICRGNGNKKLVGTGSYSSQNHPDLIFPDTVIAAQVDTTKVCMQYLHEVWKQPSIRRQIEANARTTNGTFKINQKVISNIELPVPSMELQQQFSAFVQSVDLVKSTVQASLDELETLKQSLMQEYFG